MANLAFKSPDVNSEQDKNGRNREKIEIFAEDDSGTNEFDESFTKNKSNFIKISNLPHEIENFYSNFQKRIGVEVIYAFVLDGLHDEFLL